MNRKMKSKKHLLFRLIIMLCLLSASVCTMTPSVFATENIDIGKTGSLKLSCNCNDSTLEGMIFRLYRVANVSEAAVFSLSGDFKNYKVNLKNRDASGWKDAANTLATYIKPDSIQALKEQSVDSNGNITFGGLSTGLYLVVGDKVTIGRTVYSAAPFLVSMPSLQEDNTWVYDFNAAPKISYTTSPGSNDNPKKHEPKNVEITTDVTVLKIWNDSGKKNKRPESIKVTLLQDGSIYDTETLTEDNYWRHTWSELDTDCEWTVIENDVPESYTVTYGINETVLTITNTNLLEIPDDTMPLANIERDGDKAEGTLPQTGMLWWLVDVMAVLGILMFGMGWWINSDHREKKNEK